MNAVTGAFPSDHHGWAELLPRREPWASLAENRRVAWAVVGAGLTGLACARQLSKLHPDQEILLLDARNVSQGASGRNSGFVVSSSQFNGGFDTAQIDHYRRINRINQYGLERLDAEVTDSGIDCQWRREGFYHTAADDSAMIEHGYYRQYLEALEIDHQLVGASELQALLGTDLYQSGIHIADGALVQPAALVQGLAQNLPANVSLHERSPVLRIQPGNPARLQLPDAEVIADGIVLATNYEAGKLGYLGSRIMGSTLAGSFTRILTQPELESLGSLSEWGAISLHSGGATLRLTQDSRISIRNTAEYHGAKLLSDEALQQRQTVHRAAFEKRFPQLADVPFEFAWSGVEGITRNGTNFFGKQHQGVFLAGGYNGSGVSRGTAFGTAIADYASGEDSAIVSDCLASAPAQWIPPRPILDIAAFLKIRSRFKSVGRDR